MIALLRQLLLLVIAAALSWWFFLGSPWREQTPQTPQTPPRPEVAVSLAPAVVEPPEERAAEPVAAPAPEEELEPEPTTEPPATEPAPQGEAGPVPEEQEEPEPPTADPETEANEPPAEPEAAPQVLELERFMRDEELLEAADLELAGEREEGFSTVFLAAPEEQLDIAVAFGEELALVPVRSLDGRSSPWYRLSATAPHRVERVQGAPPLEHYHQYRDLFKYEYARLPEPLRELRRSVLSRNDIYIFAALIPAREWAALIGRRREALDRADRGLDEVHQFIVEYVRLSDEAFDLVVREVVFDDGSSFRPDNR